MREYLKTAGVVVVGLAVLYVYVWLVVPTKPPAAVPGPTAEHLYVLLPANETDCAEWGASYGELPPSSGFTVSTGVPTRDALTRRSVPCYPIRC
jgi:hypothetical protein